ncbi:RNA polymerase sigma factor [Akkermansiaceae bacterium]|nr:RNA polymerase sigma factor [Akkermansiaceae bacterium]
MTASSPTTPTDLPNSRTEAVDSSGLTEVQERRWISAAASGDLPSFEKLMALHEDRIFQLCFRLLGCREDALEASQDTFVRAHRALPRYRSSGKFSTWLCQIAVNRCRDGWKRASSRLASLCDVLHPIRAELACQRPLPDALVESREDLATLEKGLEILSGKHREILILVCVENLSHAECAEILKCSERAIEGRVYRARRLLQEWWDRQKERDLQT